MRKRLLALYPEAWRDRYGEEMAALLDDTPPSVAGTLDLLRGALAAHLRPLSTQSPQVLAGGAISSVLGCFIVLGVVGSGFAKTTENLNYAEHLHPLLGVTHSVILIAATVAAAALALAAAPLAMAALAHAHRTRDSALIKLIALPPLALAVFAGSVALLSLWLTAHHHRVGLGGWLLLGLCGLCAAGGGFACWAAPRAIMRRIDLPHNVFAVSVPAVGLVALCLVAVAAAVGVFLIGIVADAPRVGASPNGPAQVLDVTTSIAIQFGAMTALSALAVMSAARGLRALRAL